MSRKSLWILVALLGLLSLLPLVGGAYALRIGTFACMYAILAVSWNVIGGMAGYPSFATAAFFGFGAYAGGIMLAGGASLAVATVATGLLTFVAAFVVGVSKRALETDADIVVEDLSGISFDGKQLAIPEHKIIRR